MLLEQQRERGDEMETTTVGRELRFLADHYEQNQKMRKAVEERLRAVLQGRDETWGVVVDLDDTDVAAALLDIRNAKEIGPVPILGRAYRRYWQEERDTYGDMMDEWTGHPVHGWLSKVRGIGPTLGCKILARLDPEKAPHASSFWSYCGLSTIPGIKYRCAECAREHGFPQGYNVKESHNQPGAKKKCDGKMVKVGECRVAMPPGYTIPGEDGKPRRPYDSYAKCVMYNVGVSFLKAGGPYEEVYRSARAKYEAERPGWDKARKHKAALRIPQKLFLSHLWEVWRTELGLSVGDPYVVAELGHQKIGPWEMVE